LPTDATFVVRLGTVGAAANSALAAEPIAHAPAVLGTETLVAQDVNASGQNFGTPHGVATVVYDAGAQTLTVTVNATGLTPGAHAAHIHAGSCQQQGGVLYMLTDFQANATGQVIDQTRTVTGVAGLPANGMWYLNLHLGSGNAQGDPTFILTPGGTPSQYFRPLACANS
jgi:hypothetical protein